MALGCVNILLQQLTHQMPMQPVPLGRTVINDEISISYYENHVMKSVNWAAFANNQDEESLEEVRALPSITLGWWCAHTVSHSQGNTCRLNSNSCPGPNLTCTSTAPTGDCTSQIEGPDNIGLNGCLVNCRLVNGCLYNYEHCNSRNRFLSLTT
jgi:hypothetical protein